MKIKVFADTICGWCYIGHSSLNKALEEFKDVQFEIEHMPFQLNPDMPKDGIERSRYLKIKPNTVLSHLLINLGEKENKQNEIKEKIYQSYFIEGLDIGDKEILINIGKEFDINEDKINEFFNLENIEKNITGVPFFEIGNDFISGAQSSSNLTTAIKNNLN